MRVSVVDLGTNSTRLLVADVDAQGDVTELERRTTVTRLGQGLERARRLAPDARGRVLDTLAAYRELIDAHDAGAHTVAVLTSAVRDADDGDDFAAEVRDRFALDARTVPGEEEARLAFLGATSARPADDGAGPLAVVDIGGGSTEVIVGEGRQVRFFVSMPVGVVRQSERHLTTDPPEAAELAALAADVHAVLEEQVPDEVRAAVRRVVAVAGTATSAAAIDLGREPYDPAAVHGHVVTRAALEAQLARLRAMTNADRRKVKGLHPDRAPTIVAGLVILLAVLDAFGADAFEASEHDLLRGAALDLWARATDPGGAPA